MRGDEHTESGSGSDFERDVGVPAALRGGMKVFGAPAGQPRARRATDVVLLVPALVGVVVAIIAYPPARLERSLQRFLTAMPDWLDSLWGFLVDTVWLWAILLVAAALVRRRFVAVAQAVAALVLALLCGVIAARLAVGAWPNVGDAAFGTSKAPPFPDVRICVAAAVVLAVSPFLTRPLQRLSRWLIVLGAVGAAVAGDGTPAGAAAAVLIALVAALGVRLIFGTSVGRPGLAEVAAGLVELGVAAHSLEEAERQEAGVFVVRALGVDGERLLIKVYGRDAYDSQLLARLWRVIWYRESGAPLGLGRLQAAEHEAFVTLLARRGGLATHDVVTAASTIDDDALLVLRGSAVPLASLAPAGSPSDLLEGAWRALGVLHRLRIAHQQIDPSALVDVSGHVGLVGLAQASVAPDERQLATDRAQLLMTTASLWGAEPAIAAAVDATGADGLAAVLPYLQSAALRPALRRSSKAAGIDADDVRKQAAAAIGVEPPQLVKLRRVTWWSVAQLALLVFASNAILTAAGNIDWEEVWSALENASWGWIVAGVVAAQLPRVTQAVATLGSVPASLPFGPVYAMQLATGYMNVALPSNFARMAISIRFFQRQGLSAPTAVASGAIDSFASTVIQACLLVVLLLFSESSLAIDLPIPSGSARRLIALLAGAALLTVAVVALVPRLRALVVGSVRRWWPDIRAALGALRASNKLAMLVLGSLATEILFATALGLFARGLGYELPLAELLVINISVSLLASFIPVPGGIGVTEFGLTAGLSAAGMTPEAALAATLLYRVATFYLPPAWGFVSLHWLQRNRYL
jgi:uncharacterized membrane protein YbhN (UPF0104 family)